MNSVILFNPRSANYKPRIPNSILSIAAALEGMRDYVIVDGNLETDPAEKIFRYLSQGRFKYFATGSSCGSWFSFLVHEIIRVVMQVTNANNTAIVLVGIIGLFGGCD